MPLQDADPTPPFGGLGLKKPRMKDNLIGGHDDHRRGCARKLGFPVGEDDAV